MAEGTEEGIFYFQNKGPTNTDKALDIALAGCNTRAIDKIVVASSIGETALKLHDKAQGAVQIIAVTYNSGSRFMKEVEAFKKTGKLWRTKGS